MITIEPQILASSFEILSMLLWAFLLWILYAKSINYTPESQTKDSKSSKKTVAHSGVKRDDLQLIEWIWPALEKVLQQNGVNTYKDIVAQDISWLEKLLESLGGRYASYNPTTWPDQADLAKRKKWTELEEYQEIMKNSKKKSS